MSSLPSKRSSALPPLSPSGPRIGMSPRLTSSYVNMDTLLSSDTVSDEEQRAQEEEEHRERFLSDAERLIVKNPREARLSFASMEAHDAWHTTSLDGVAKLLATDFERGLDSSDHDSRIAKYGQNVLEEEPRTPTYITFLLQFYNLIISMLLFAAVASLALKEYVEGIAILFIVFLNATIATIQENSASNALEALSQLSSPQSTVVRDGVQQVVDSKDLVPGDVVVLVTGDVVPADIRLVHSSDLKVNEMLLTGESEDVAKKYNVPMNGKSNKLTADNMVFSSTTVTAGNARGIVVETGMGTRVGSIASLLKAKKVGPGKKKGFRNPLSNCIAKYQPKLTPLQRSLHKLGFVMGTIALTVCALVFAVGMIRGNKDPKHPDRPVWLVMIMLSVSLAVSAVPEGLPMVVTICLSSGTADMVKQNVLVRKLAAVETLGAASVICTDKTGTLTEGKMTAVKLWGDFKEYDVTGKGFVPEGSIFLNGVDQTAAGGRESVHLRVSLLVSVLCSNTQLKQKDVDGVLTWVPFGNSSEVPLIVAAAKAGIWEEHVAEEYKRVAEVPFSSSRKMMITLNELPTLATFNSLVLDESTKYVACVKGAPNYILDNCTRYCQADGSLAALSDEQRHQVMDAVDNLSSQALRVLAVAMQPLASIPYPSDCDDIDEKFAALSRPLVFLGLVASIDPERDGVRDAIATARLASIRTVMITGDYLKTAVAIAKNIDLLQDGVDPELQATDCTQLRPRDDVYLAEHEIDEITSRTTVFARAKPEDKIEIVKSLQRQGLISAMTGDGVNDAPALKEADIGVAMGISGTEVAKGASDMVLTDDNFCSIVSAVEKGRVIYANIQKFVMFLLSTNIGEIILIFTTVAAGFPAPMEALQILILNLFSDGMPAVALSLEKGDSRIMEDGPRPKKQPLIHGRLWTLVAFNAIIIASGAIAASCLGVYWSFGRLVLSDILKQGGGAHGDDFKDVTCQRWEGVGNGWKTYGNCNAMKSNGTFVFPDLENRDFYEDSSMYCEGGEYECLSEGIAMAQTMTFVCITFTEVLRAYTVRSFTLPVFVGMFSNKYMQFAASLSVILTIFVTNTPVIMTDIFGFAYIAWFKWLVSVAGALNSVFWGETLKAFLRFHDRKKVLVADHIKELHVSLRNLPAPAQAAPPSRPPSFPHPSLRALYPAGSMFGIEMPKIYGAPAYMVILAVVLSVIYVVLVFQFIQHMRGLGVTWSGKKHKTVLVVGPRNAGKTQLFHAIRDGEIVETVSSMKELSATFRVHPKYNPDKFDAELNVVDFPGHERLRSRVSDFYPITGCIVFVLDASDSPMLRKAAEYLYDIFSNAKVNDISPPLLIACNKSDVAGAMTPEAIRESLEKELTQLKTTRSSLDTEGEDQDLSTVPVGRDGAAFQFDVDAPCEVTFAKSSVKGGSVNEIVAFMIKY